eukprot:83992_1
MSQSASNQPSSWKKDNRKNNNKEEHRNNGSMDENAMNNFNDNNNDYGMHDHGNNRNVNNNNNNVMDDTDDMAAVFQMMSKLNLGVYAQIASTHSNSDRNTLRNYLTKQLMNDLTKLGYSKEQQQKANIPAVVDLICTYICT